jgi:hypothetical protein
MSVLETIGTLAQIAKNFLVLITPEGRKQIPYKQLNVTYDGMTLEELKRKRVKAIIWEDGTVVEITRPNE